MPNLVLRLALCVVVVGACASRRERGPVVEPPDLIARHQIEAANVQTVYELVERLHPLWLRKRGTNRLQDDGDIVVYLDNARLGGPEALRDIHVAGVASVRFFDAGRAQFRFGVGHAHGAILVSTGTR